jgi:succinate dehydrogenase / fumarate reductase membrane anchor subunit
MSGGSQTPVTDFRTPLKRARGLGSAKTGTSHFWLQRATAVALVFLVAWFIGTLVSLAGADLQTVRAAIARPCNAILLASLAVALFWHAKLGLQVIVEDYVHARGPGIALQLLVNFLCAIGALASLFAIARIALSG